MRAVVETTDGDRFPMGVDGLGREAVDEALDYCPDAYRVWVLGDYEDYDEGADPDWTLGDTALYRIYGPAGSGVIRLPWTGEDWEALMEREYPMTYEAMETFEGERVDSGDVLCDEEAACLFHRHYERDLEPVPGSISRHIRADLDEGQATIRWLVKEGQELYCVEQAIDLNPGDFLNIVEGADPEREGWEDGDGHPVCLASARELYYLD